MTFSHYTYFYSFIKIANNTTDLYIRTGGQEEPWLTNLRCNFTYGWGEVDLKGLAGWIKGRVCLQHLLKISSISGGIWKWSCQKTQRGQKVAKTAFMIHRRTPMVLSGFQIVASFPTIVNLSMEGSLSGLEFKSSRIAFLSLWVATSTGVHFRYLHYDS